MIYLFTDGSSSKLQKTIGSGYVAFKEDNINSEPIFRESVGFKNVEGIKTGASELIAVWKGLHELYMRELEGEEIIIISDSQYVINELTIWYKSQLSKRFINTKNTELIISILHFITEFKNLKFEWTRGHTDKKDFYSEGNNIADTLATSCHRGITEIEELEDFNSFIQSIDKDNKEYKLFNFIYDYYILNKKK